MKKIVVILVSILGIAAFVGRVAGQNVTEFSCIGTTMSPCSGTLGASLRNYSGSPVLTYASVAEYRDMNYISLISSARTPRRDYVYRLLRRSRKGRRPGRATGPLQEQFHDFVGRRRALSRGRWPSL